MHTAKRTQPILQARRGRYYDVTTEPIAVGMRFDAQELAQWEKIDLIYRTLCAIMYNFVPTSGHPGGSISSGRIVQGLIYQGLDYDLGQPDRPDNDILSYAAGHKAMGLYANWALRNELARVARPDLLAPEKRQLRLEDLLGFRRNPTTTTPLFRELRAKALDGHPTCYVPFVKHATGASGVGVPTAFGLAMGAMDVYRDDSPRVHVLEGEGGMTPGRVHEALAAAATLGLSNVILHVDFNQASIDSNHVCLDEKGPGDYVQWNPLELTLFHDWNAIHVADGMDFRQILAAQRLALSIDNGQPTAVVYRTVKGWRYGIEGRVSHGAGHKFASEGYYTFLQEFESAFSVSCPRFEGDKSPERIERCYYDTLMVVRNVMANDKELTRFAGEHLAAARERVNQHARKRADKAPQLGIVYNDPEIRPDNPPEALRYKPGDLVTLRDALGNAIGDLNRRTKGAFFAAAADLSGSTSVANIGKGFPEGWYHARKNPDARLVPIGGICEDSMGAMMSGLASFGEHIGVSSSYGAFIAALEHIAARLHGIGQQAREAITGQPYDTWIMVNAHAGVKTGEDGPTHADPQALQLLQECFPGKVMITLTPWDVREIWPLLITSLHLRPAVLAPFVTRPADKLADWGQLRLPSIMETTKGVYALRRADPSASRYDGTIVLQGNGVATIFVNEVLPRLDQAGYNLNIYYISSVELFNQLPATEREKIFPEKLALESMGITDFTLPTMYRWVRSPLGLEHTLHSFRKNHYLGSGAAEKVLEEAGIHATGQWDAITAFVRTLKAKR
jgi:transketolase